MIVAENCSENQDLQNAHKIICVFSGCAKQSLASGDLETAITITDTTSCLVIQTLETSCSEIHNTLRQRLTLQHYKEFITAPLLTGLNLVSIITEHLEALDSLDVNQIESHEITQRERLLATSRNIKTRLAQIKAMPWPEFIARGAGFGAGILLDYLIFKGCGLVIRRLASLILSNTIIQKIFNDIAIGVKIGTETGPGAAKTTIDIAN